MEFQVAWNRAAWLALLAIAGFWIDLLAWWPGLMSFDSAYAWWQARGGETTDVGSPVMIALWSVLDDILEGPGLVFALHAALFWIGLGLVLYGERISHWKAIVAVGVVGFNPLIWLLRGQVWTDTGMMSALLGAAGMLAAFDRCRRSGFLVLALVLMFYAIALRHNAWPAVFPLLYWWVLLAFGETSWRSRSARIIGRSLIAVVLASAMSIVLAAINSRVDHHVPIWPSLAEWDLAALSIASDTMLLPSFMIGPGLTVDELGAAFRPWSNVPMLQNTHHGMRDPLLGEYTTAELATLGAAWRSAIMNNPFAWLRHRLRLTVALFGRHPADWPRELIYSPIEYQYRDNPAVIVNDTSLRRLLLRAAECLRSTSALAAWPYLLVGLAALPLAWRKRWGDRIFVAVMLASAWSYALPLVFIAPAAETRYLGWSCLASLVALISFGRARDKTTE